MQDLLRINFARAGRFFGGIDLVNLIDLQELARLLGVHV